MHHAENVVADIYGDQWYRIAYHLPKPWPREAAWLDLIITEGRVKEEPGTRMPGRKRLAARWGWGAHKVANFLRAFYAFEEMPGRFPRYADMALNRNVYALIRTTKKY